MRAMLVVAAVVLGACGSGGTGGSGGSGGGTATGGGSGGGTATGGGSGGGSATGGGSGGGSATGGGSGGSGGGSTTKLGSVSLSQLEGLPFLGNVRSGSAGFYPDGPPTVQGGLACTFTTMGSCQVSDCFSDGGIPTITGRLTGAGAVTVQAGTVGFALPQGMTGSYSGSGSDGGLWWTGGEAVTATASGSTDGGVPAFTASFTAPTKLTVTAPASDGGTLVVQKGVALPVTWTPGTGTVLLELQSGQLLGGRSVKLSCTANASAGTFTFTAPLTQLLLATNAGSLQISNASQTTVTPGGWTITATATSTGTTRTVSVP